MHQPTHEIVLPFVTKSPRTIFHAPYTFITQPSSTPRTVGSMRASSLTAYVHHVRLYICLEALQVLLHTQRQLNSIVKTSNSLYILRFTRHFIYVYLRICTVPRLCRNSSYSICTYLYCLFYIHDFPELIEVLLALVDSLR